MNLQSNALGESPHESAVTVPAVIPATQRFYWCVRRELWENRSIYLAPLAVAALFLAGYLISTGSLPKQMLAASALDWGQQQELFQQPYTFVAMVLMATTLLVAAFYCLDALHGERRDRSILFWKSLPVSDLTTVLAKASIPLFVLPVITVVITVATHCIMLLMSSLVMLAYGLNVATLWSHVPLLQMSSMILFHMVAIHGLWYAPFYCWLLLVSGWARRAALLWAVLPLLGIGVTEKIAFNTSYFAAMLGNRLGGGAENVAFTSGHMVMAPLRPFGLGRFLISPGLWAGLLVAAALLAAAVQLRRYRDPM